MEKAAPGRQKNWEGGGERFNYYKAIVQDLRPWPPAPPPHAAFNSVPIGKE